MAYTLAELRAEVRELVGDDDSYKWSNTQIDNNLKRSIREAYPAWWKDIHDETSFVGVNAPAPTTLTLAVPSTFLASGTRPHGAIWLIEFRHYQATGTNLNGWSRLTKAFKIDDLSLSSPQIRFHYSDGYKYDYRIIGGIPITIPANDSTAIPETDMPGLKEFLLWQAVSYGHSQRQKAQTYDRENHQAQRLLAAQEAGDIKKIHMKQARGKTTLNNYGKR